MSHIPSSAMPHAKPHDHDETHEAHEAAPPPPAPAAETKAEPVDNAPPLPWLAIALGGALIAGTAAAVALASRKPDGGGKRRAAKSAGCKSAGKPRRRKADADA